MFKKIQLKSEFSKNVLTLITGTSVAQAIPIAVSPVLTRIYSPEDFGTLALYMSLVSILSVIVTGQYDLAIMLPKSNTDGFNILVLSLVLSLTVSLGLFLIFCSFNEYISSLLNNSAISVWLYLVPFSVLVLGFFNSVSYWFVRVKKFKTLSVSKLVQSSTNTGFSLSLGLLNLTNFGLIASSFFSQLIAVLILLKKIDINLFRKIGIKEIIFLARRYRRFPQITLPHSIFSSVSQALPIFMITKYFSSVDVGFVSLGNRIVMLPLGLISSAYYKVFFQAFADEKDKLNFYRLKFKEINLIFLPLFACLWFILPDVFIFIFGAKWEIAGEYSQIMLPLFYLKFISNLFTATTYIYYEKQFENFALSVFITLSTLSSLILGVYMDDIKVGLFFVTVTNGAVIILKLYRSYSFVKNYHVRY